MNPAALKANIADVPRGAEIIVNTDEFTKRAMQKVGYADQPAGGRLAGRLQRPPGAADHADRRGAQGVRPLPQGGRAQQEHVRAGPAVVDVPPADRGHGEVPAHEVRQEAARSRRRTSPRSARAGTSARRPRTSRSPTRSPRPPQAFPTGTYRNISGNLALSYGLIAASPAGGPAAVPGLVPDHPGLRHPARAEPGTRTSACGPSRPRTRSPGIGAALGAAFGGSLAVTTTSGPGCGAEVGDDRARGVAGAAAAGHRHPARRPLHRPADQDRAGRPAAGDVRPQRRGPGADRGPAHPRRLLRRGRSRRPGSRSPTAPRSSCSPTATWPTAPSRGGSPRSTNSPTCACSSPRAPTTPWTTAPRCSGPTSATRRPWPAPGRSRARRAWSTASAASRSRTAPATSPTTRPTTTSWSAPARPRSTASTSPTSRSTTRTGAADHPRPGLGFDLRADHRGGTAAARGRASASRRPICATSTPSRATSARC